MKTNELNIVFTGHLISNNSVFFVFVLTFLIRYFWLNLSAFFQFISFLKDKYTCKALFQIFMESKKISNDQELIQSDPTYGSLYNLLVLIKLNLKYTVKFQCILKMSVSLFMCK